jgi:putative hydrolases of HD superfamily
MPDDRISRQLAFLIEADKLKTILRRTSIAGGARRENSAEHSWHLALCAMVLAEHSAQPVDPAKVLRMLIVHDAVEIDAGDTFAYDKAGNLTKNDRERAAAERIFGLLPGDTGRELRALWEEFEAHASPEACFAHAMDRLQPFLLNRENRGGTWLSYHLSREEVLARMDPIRTTIPALWPTVVSTINQFFPAA